MDESNYERAQKLLVRIAHYRGKIEYFDTYRTLFKMYLHHKNKVRDELKQENLSRLEMILWR